MGAHSLRNIGFHFLEQTVTCRKWQDKFRGYRPERAVGSLCLPCDEAYIYVTYLGKHYRLACETGILEKEIEDGSWSPDLFMNEALVIYHLLGDVQDAPSVSGIWCPESELDPVQVRSGNRMDPLMREFAKRCSGHQDVLEQKAVLLGGRRLEKGDAGFEFYPFPFFPVRLIFWEADEDFPAQVQLLVDKNAAQYMHFEAVSCVLADLMTYIIF